MELVLTGKTMSAQEALTRGMCAWSRFALHLGVV